MRREDRLRQARDWFFKNYFADTLADAMRLAAPGTETGAFVMMVFGYLERAANRYETWIEARSPGHIAAMREFTKRMRAQPAKAA